MLFLLENYVNSIIQGVYKEVERYELIENMCLLITLLNTSKNISDPKF